jgi:hypothetical protein
LHGVAFTASSTAPTYDAFDDTDLPNWTFWRASGGTDEITQAYQNSADAIGRCYIVDVDGVAGIAGAIGGPVSSPSPPSPAKKVIIIDVRTPSEWAQGHVSCALGPLAIQDDPAGWEEEVRCSFIVITFLICTLNPRVLLA